MDNENPWVSRFDHLLTRDQLKAALDMKIEPIANPFKLTIEDLCMRFRVQCRETFYPTEQCIDAAEHIVGVARAFAQHSYPNKKHFLKKIYSEEIDFFDVKPIVLSGYAGMGKSSLLKAVSRAIGQTESIKVDDSHPPFQMSAAFMLTVHERISLTQLMISITGVSHRTDDLLKLTKKVVYQKGIPLLFVDEFQFLATSASANTLIAKLLLGISYIGIPFTYAANFSMIDKLLKRPEEEKQRIISDVIVIHPDHHNTVCWHKTIEYVLDIAPELFSINLEESAKRLFEITAGRKRALVELVIESIRQRKNFQSKVTMREIEAAFKSSKYATYRIDAEIIASQLVVGRPSKGRRDLWCPPEFKTLKSVETSKEFSESRIHQVAQLDLNSAISPAERQLIKSVEADLNGNQKREKAKVIKMPTASKNMSLLESTINFLDDI